MPTEDIIRFTLPLPSGLIERLNRHAVARSRSRNRQAEVLLTAALNLGVERLPEPNPGEEAIDYHKRLQRIADGGA